MEQEKLNGLYKISFEMEIDPNDRLSLSDIAQALTESFGEELIGKVSHLKFDKISKHGNNKPVILKIGDAVQLKNSIKINADVYHDDGYVFTGNKNDVSELVAENAELNIEAGSFGYINKISGDVIEIANLDKPYINPLWQEVGIDHVNIDLITVNADQIEKVDFEEKEVK